MYGQNINYRHGIVRAILLEMQRRKVNFGADGVRVDGAQDFKYWGCRCRATPPWTTNTFNQWADIVQNVGGKDYRPWFIFEDGRLWPQEDWELSSTYRAVLETQRDDDVFPVGAAYLCAQHTISLWLLAFEMVAHQRDRADGANWISGCANHDTLGAAHR